MKNTVVRRAAAALLAAAFFPATAAAAPAASLEPGVHVDPGSPAAKEYALPLSQARQTGGEGSAGGGSSSPALFGAGISVKRALGARGARHEEVARASAHGGRRGNGEPRSGTPAETASRVLALQGSSPRGGADAMLALLGGGVLVLVLGAFLGVVLRGRRTAN